MHRSNCLLGHKRIWWNHIKISNDSTAEGSMDMQVEAIQTTDKNDCHSRRGVIQATAIKGRKKKTAKNVQFSEPAVERVFRYDEHEDETKPEETIRTKQNPQDPLGEEGWKKSLWYTAAEYEASRKCLKELCREYRETKRFCDCLEQVHRTAGSLAALQQMKMQRQQQQQDDSVLLRPSVELLMTKSRPLASCSTGRSPLPGGYMAFQHGQQHMHRRKRPKLCNERTTTTSSRGSHPPFGSPSFSPSSSNMLSRQLVRSAEFAKKSMDELGNIHNNAICCSRSSYTSIHATDMVGEEETPNTGAHNELLLLSSSSSLPSSSSHSSLLTLPPRGLEGYSCHSYAMRRANQVQETRLAVLVEQALQSLILPKDQPRDVHRIAQASSQASLHARSLAVVWGHADAHAIQQHHPAGHC